MYLFLAVLGLCYYTGFSRVVGSRDDSLVTGCGLLIVMAAIAEPRLSGARFSSCGTWAQWLTAPAP